MVAVVAVVAEVVEVSLSNNMLLNLLNRLRAAALEQLEVIGSAGLDSSANDLFTLKLDQQLCLQPMAALLAPIIAFLFFLGPSISISPTSTSITLRSQPG
jgi:hypothetical protein